MGRIYRVWRRRTKCRTTCYSVIKKTDESTSRPSQSTINRLLPTDLLKLNIDLFVFFPIFTAFKFNITEQHILFGCDVITLDQLQQC